MKEISEQDYRRIKAFVFDVDGVLTDGGLLSDLNGQLYRTFNAKDGFAIRMANLNGYHIGVITGGRSQSIRCRFKGNGIEPEDIYLGARDKIKDLKDFCKRHGISTDEVMYFGDDLPDIPCIAAAGLGVCPADAVEDVKEYADVVATLPGGKACVREMLEKTMKIQGRWVFNVGDYTKKF